MIQIRVIPEITMAKVSAPSHGEHSKNQPDARLVALGLTLLIAALAVAVGLFTWNFSRMSTIVVGLQEDIAAFRQQQPISAGILNRERNSVCYIHAVYTLAAPGYPRRQWRVSGTGFVVADGIIATNRHVVQPWWSDPGDQALMRAGAKPHLRNLVAFFPSVTHPVELREAQASATSDLAIARFSLPTGVQIEALPLAEDRPRSGDPIVVLGYPAGLSGLLAKSPRSVLSHMRDKMASIDVIGNLAASSLIRPTVTYGHLGDVASDTIVYDAPTSYGGSGGPVLNSRGQVIGVNTAFLVDFAGGSIGSSIETLKPLLRTATQRP